MASNTKGYVDADGLTTKDVRVIVSAFKAMDTEKLPMPDYELMSKIYPWKWPSNGAKSEMCRLKGKMKVIRAKLNATHSAKPGKKSNATKKTNAKFKVTKSIAKKPATTEKATTKKVAPEMDTPEMEYDEDSETRNSDDIVEDIMDDIVDEVVRYTMDNEAA